MGKSESQGYITPYKKALIDENYPKNFDARLVQTQSDLKECVAELKSVKKIALDTETTSTDWGYGHIVGMSCSTNKDSGWYIPFRHEEYDRNLPTALLPKLYEIVKDKLILMYNAPFDETMFNKEGWDCSKLKIRDVMGLVYLMDTNIHLPSLKDSELFFLGRKAPTFEETLKGREHFGWIPPEEVTHYACHARGTEVLTKKGWILWEDVNNTTEFLTCNLQTNTLEYQKPIRLVKYKYKGKMYHYTGNTFDFNVTPNHNMLIYKGQKKSKEDCIIFRTAEELHKHEVAFTGIPTKQVYTANNLWNLSEEDFAYLIGLIVGDGWTHKHSKNNRGYATTIVSSKNKQTFDKITNFLDSLPFNWKIKERDNGSVYYTVYDKALWQLLSPCCGQRSWNKRVPEFIKTMSVLGISRFLEGLIDTDGGKSSKNTVTIYTTSLSLVNDIQELYILLGKRSSFNIKKQTANSIIDGRKIKAKHTLYNVFMTEQKTFWYQSRTCILEDYDDYVYCAEVPNHTLYTRYNGKTLLSGNCTDTGSTYGLDELLYPMISKECPTVLKLDTAFVPVLLSLCSTKLPVRKDLLPLLESYYADEMKEKEKKIFKSVGYPFNLRSNKQLETAFNQLNIKTGYYTDKGNMSLKAEVLELIQEKYPFVKDIVSYKSMSSTLSALKKFRGKDWIRCNYEMYNTVTGRMSSGSAKDEGKLNLPKGVRPYFDKFNAQNFLKAGEIYYKGIYKPEDPYAILGYRFKPIEKKNIQPEDLIVECMDYRGNPRRLINCCEKDEDGNIIFDEKTHYWVKADYAGAELRLATLFSKEPVLMKAFLEGIDPHTNTAMSMFGVADKPHRGKAKTCNFSLLYEGSADSLTRNSGLSYEDADELWHKYWQTMKVLKQWKVDEQRRTNVSCVCRTFMGRPRRLHWYFRHPKLSMRSFAKRSVISHEIQGSLGDIIKLTLIKSHKQIFHNPDWTKNNDAKFYMTIHDEIDAGVRKERLEEYLDTLLTLGKIQIPGWEFPLELDCDLGYSYGFVVPIKRDKETGKWKVKFKKGSDIIG